MAQQNYGRQVYGDARYREDYAPPRQGMPGTGQYRAPAPRAGGTPPRRRRRKTRRKSKWWLLPVLLVVLALGITLVFRLIQGASDGEGTGLFGLGAKTVGPPWVVVIDPGHGGGDVGAEGLVNEAQLNELTAAKLYALLEADPDFTPVLTRQAGEGATLKERGKVAKNAGAHLFLSIHGNSDGSAATSGFECFPTPPGRKYHEESLEMASLIAQEMGAAGATLRGEGGVRYAYYDAAGDKYFAEASDLTVNKDKSFAVVESTGCPSVLIEQCFITNEGDMALFGGEEGSQRAAQCYYQAIVQYFKG